MTKELELRLNGTPGMAIECVMGFVKTLASEGYPYKCAHRIGGAPDYSKRDRTYSALCDIFVVRNDSNVKIGTIRFQLLPSEHTLLKVEEPSSSDSPLGHFLSRLVGEFKRLGFVGEVDTMNVKPLIIQQLISFSSEIATYQYLHKKERLPLAETNLMTDLRISALKNVGKFKPLITEITEKENLTIRPRDGSPPYTIDVWLTALKIDYDQRADDSIDRCLDLLNVTIGRLETDISSGERDPNTGKKVNSTYETLDTSIKPKAFIVHGGKSGVLEKLCDFVEALGIKPLIVEMLPSKGMTVADKVKKYQQEADCAIILATLGGIIDTTSGKQHPRLNVIDELSSFYEAFPEKVIVLLEKGAVLPSNKAGLTYEPFVRQSMDRAFSAIARELVEMKILKAVKPSQRSNLV